MICSRLAGLWVATSYSLHLWNILPRLAVRTTERASQAHVANRIQEAKEVWEMSCKNQTGKTPVNDGQDMQAGIENS